MARLGRTCPRFLRRGVARGLPCFASPPSPSFESKSSERRKERKSDARGGTLYGLGNSRSRSIRRRRRPQLSGGVSKRGERTFGKELSFEGRAHSRGLSLFVTASATSTLDRSRNAAVESEKTFCVVLLTLTTLTRRRK